VVVILVSEGLALVSVSRQQARELVSAFLVFYPHLLYFRDGFTGL